MRGRVARKIVRHLRSPKVRWRQVPDLDGGTVNVGRFVGPRWPRHTIERALAKLRLDGSGQARR